MPGEKIGGDAQLNESPINRIIETMRNSAKMLRSIEDEEVLALNSGDLAGFKAKQQERTEALVTMIESVESMAESIDSELKNEILLKMSEFRHVANNALEKGNGFTLSKKGDLITDPNSLELFIAELEKTL
jgi:hypothetical protein